MTPWWNKKKFEWKPTIQQSEAGGIHPSKPGAAGHCYLWTSYFTQDKGGRRPDPNTGLKTSFSQVPLKSSSWGIQTKGGS